MTWHVIHADCIEAMRELGESSIDAIVTDPPYALSFMGRTWDSFRGADIDPGFLHWFAGFTDGEGCFSVHKKNVNGFETYDCQFSITLRADDRPILERIHRTLGIGTLSKPSAHRTGNENPKSRYSVSAKAELVALRDIFRAFPLRAKKARDLELWSDALDAWLAHEPGEWSDMAEARAVLMASREYVDEGVRVDPFQMWCWRWGREALRVLKPGGHALVFGGTRTHHRMAAGLEDAGFEIRDTLAFLYGSGFPKSLDVSKAIDKAAGAAREVVGTKLGQPGYSLSPEQGNGVAMEGNVDGSLRNPELEVAITAPATPDAERWQGWGTALKPAFEPIVLARKPLSGTVAQNVLEYGTGALNVDGARIGLADGETPESVYDAPTGPGFGAKTYGEDALPPVHVTGHASGRWPANVILDPEAAEMLDEQSGERGDKGGGFYVQPPQSKSYRDGRTVQGARDVGDFPFHYGDSGGASRFFYTAKTSRSERERGVREYGEIDAESKRRFASGGRTQIDGEWVETHSDPVPMRNVHPTVKPVDLMQWLCRLITPPKGLILDPFLGSGSTGIAALREGFDFVGIEREAEYVEIARARIIGDAPLFNVEEVIAEDISP